MALIFGGCGAYFRGGGGGGVPTFGGRLLSSSNKMLVEMREVEVELFDNNFSFIWSFISLQSIFSKIKKENFYALTFFLGGGGRLLLGGAYCWGGAYYRSLISSLQQMRLLLGGAYYRGRLFRKFTVSPVVSFRKSGCNKIKPSQHKAVTTL